jgi:uncharacterized membrane protein
MDRPRRRSLVAGVTLTLALTCLLVATAPATPVEAATPADGHAGEAPAPAVVPPIAAANTTDIDPDAVVMSVDVAPNGSAQWQVAYRLRLDDENATAAFESLQADVAANETAYTARFARRMNRTASVAAESTGREMSIGTVSVSTERETLPQEYGIVTYEFRWFGFAAVEGDRLAAGDAIAGLFLDRQTTLRVRWPEDYRLTAVDPEPDEERASAVVWRGPAEFTDAQPRVTIAESTPTPTDSPAIEPVTDTPQESENAPVWLIGGLFVLLVLAVLAWGGYRRLDGVDGSDGATGAGSAASTGTGSGGETPTDPELLSNEERVLRLLEANGGRMKQQAIAEELEWTDAKTSQVIGDLREAEDVETFRLGRENVVTLPDAGGPIE